MLHEVTQLQRRAKKLLGVPDPDTDGEIEELLRQLENVTRECEVIFYQSKTKTSEEQAALGETILELDKRRHRLWEVQEIIWIRNNPEEAARNKAIVQQTLQCQTPAPVQIEDNDDILDLATPLEPITSCDNENALENDRCHLLPYDGDDNYDFSRNWIPHAEEQQNQQQLLLLFVSSWFSHAKTAIDEDQRTTKNPTAPSFSLDDDGAIYTQIFTNNRRTFSICDREDIRKYATLNLNDDVTTSDSSANDLKEDTQSGVDPILPTEAMSLQDSTTTLVEDTKKASKLMIPAAAYRIMATTKAAIETFKEKANSSRQVILKYILANKEGRTESLREFDKEPKKDGATSKQDDQNNFNSEEYNLTTVNDFALQCYAMVTGKAAKNTDDDTFVLLDRFVGKNNAADDHGWTRLIITNILSSILTNDRHNDLKNRFFFWTSLLPKLGIG